MTKIGLIDNLSHIDFYQKIEALEASSDQLFTATGGNTGNLAFVKGAMLSIDNDITRIGWDWDASSVKQHVNQLVICCANQIGSHVDLGGWAERIAAFGLPVTLIGLGAQVPNYEEDLQIPSGTRLFLETVHKYRANKDFPNIAVRGNFTASKLRDLGYESCTIGCPSLFISPNAELGSDISSCSIASAPKFAIAGGNPYHRASACLEKKLISLVNQANGAYIAQHPKIMLSLALDDISDNDIVKLDSIIAELGFLSCKDCIKWFRYNSYAFHDVVNWIGFLRHFDIVLGPRYHGVALGVQAGKHSVCIHIDKRTQELCETTMIKSISINEFMAEPREAISANCQWTTQEALDFDKNRLYLANLFQTFLAKNSISPSTRLVNLANSSMIRLC